MFYCIIIPVVCVLHFGLAKFETYLNKRNAVLDKELEDLKYRSKCCKELIDNETFEELGDILNKNDITIL